MAESKIHTLEVPEFKSDIPEYLIKEYGDDIKHTIRTTSINEQKLKWLEERAVTEDTERQKVAIALEETAKSVKSLLTLVDRFKGGWRLAALIATAIGLLLSMGNTLANIFKALRGGG